jgi:hypothetical protein
MRRHAVSAGPWLQDRFPTFAVSHLRYPARRGFGDWGTWRLKRVVQALLASNRM